MFSVEKIKEKKEKPIKSKKIFTLDQYMNNMSLDLEFSLE